MLLCVIAPASQDSADNSKYLVAASNSFVVVLLPLRRLQDWGHAANKFCLDSSSWQPKEVCPQTLEAYVAYSYKIQYWEHDQGVCDYVLQVRVDCDGTGATIYLKCSSAQVLRYSGRGVKLSGG